MGKYDHSKFDIISCIETAPIAIEISQDKWTKVPLIKTCGIFLDAIAFTFQVLQPIKISCVTNTIIEY